MAVRRRANVPLRQPINVDWNHPLSRSLVGCWLPGITGPFDIAKKISPLVQQSACATGTGPDGPGLNSSANSAAYTLLAPTVLKILGPDNGFTLYWRGFQLSTPDANSNYIVVSYDNASGSPFVVFGIGLNGSSQLAWQGNNGSFQSFLDTSAPVSGLNSFAATFSSTKTQNLYKNGLITGAGQAASTPSTTATSTFSIASFPSITTRKLNCITYIAAAWNRMLTDSELLWLHLEPYSLFEENFWPGIDALGNFGSSFTGANPAILPSLQSTNIYKRTRMRAY
jgi:hypothetical protein